MTASPSSATRATMADRPEQAGGVVDQEKRNAAMQTMASNATTRATISWTLFSRRSSAITAKMSVNTKSPTRVADDVVAQESGGDDPRRQLAAGNLDRDQQGSEGEHDEREREGNNGLVQRLRAGDPEPGAPPSQPGVEPDQ